MRKMNRKIVAATVAVFALMMFVGSAMAVPPGRTLDWSSSMGKVVFSGKVHADKGLKCTDCHTKIFKMKKGSSEMHMKDINEGKFCGECHNGTKAFKSSDAANCAKCHKK
ncbi:MAG TPA: cytochrome c3 family protein [Dissulfurispiraceae bacterium]